MNWFEIVVEWYFTIKSINSAVLALAAGESETIPDLVLHYAHGSYTVKGTITRNK